MTEAYDVVLNALQTKHDELMSMTIRDMKTLERELAEAKAEITRLKGEAESWEQIFDKTCEHLADAKTALAEARKECGK